MNSSRVGKSSMSLHRQHCLAVAFFALVGSGMLYAGPASGPSDSRATVERFVAADCAIDLRGATGKVAEWLKAFDVKPQRFEYTLELRDQDEYVSAYRVTFASPFVSPWPENNVVPAELYLPRNRKGKVRSAIVLDIMAGNAILARAMARGLADGDVAALYVPMAYYNQRRPKSDPHMKIFSTDPLMAVNALRQTVMDIRRAKCILASRPEIDPDHIGITGISLGGIMTSLAAGVDGTFDRVVPILAGGDLAALVFYAPETRRLRAELTARGTTPEQLAEQLACVEPLEVCLSNRPQALPDDPTHRKMKWIPAGSTDLLAAAIGLPQVLWAPTGHYGCIAFFPSIRQTAVRFLAGESVDKLRY